MDGFATPASGTVRRSRTRRGRWVALGIFALAVASLATMALPHATSTPSCADPEIRIYKSESTLELVCAGAVTRSMPVTFGWNPVGPKEREGDGKTPEGIYRISSKQRNDRFHRFLGVSYPNAKDLEHARSMGITSPGGAIGIHGTEEKRAALARLWIRFAHATEAAKVWGPTEGCIALTNEDVEALFDAVPVGTKVVIAAAR
jgi:murein L,D-transpeptidase YafK